MILLLVNKDEANYMAREFGTPVAASYRPPVLIPRSTVHPADKEYELEEPDDSCA